MYEDPEFEALLKEAVRNARANRGQDDGDNDWFSDVVAGRAHTSENVHDEFAEDVVKPAEKGVNFKEDYEEWDPRDEVIPHDEAKRKYMRTEATSGMLTMLVRDDVTTSIENHLDATCIDQYLADASDEAGVNTLLDDTLFEQAAADIEKEIASRKYASCIAMHQGTTLNTRFRRRSPYGDKPMKHEDLEHVRVETCLVFRILRISTLFMCSALPWLIMTPHYFNKGPISITMLPELEEVQRKAFRKWIMDSRGRQYEVVSDVELPDDINEIMHAFFARVAEVRNEFLKAIKLFSILKDNKI